MHRLRLTCLLIPVLGLGIPARAFAQGAPQTVVEWVRSHAHPLAPVERLGVRDLDVFTKPIGNARVIGVGEPQHGTHEFLELRNAFLRYAVASLGVTAIAVESGYTESTQADDYVLGRRAMSPSVVASVFSWSGDTAYEENQELLEWIRSYNSQASTKRKIRVYGIDLTGGRDGSFVEAPQSIDAALEYVATVEPSQEQILRKRFDPFDKSFATGRYDLLTVDQRNALTAAIDDLIGLFERRRVAWSTATSREAFDRAYGSALVAWELNVNFRSAAAESNPQAQRDSAMAKSLMRVLQREGPEGRVLLYEANWHISKGPMASDRWGSSLGEYLQELLGSDYFSIATSFAEKQQTTGTSESSSPDPLSTAALLASVCQSVCWMNLQDLPSEGPVAQWFRVLRPIERGGPADQLIPAKAFNAEIFVRLVHSARHME